jgi:hypothetical protein
MRTSLTAQLAAFFQARPGVWVDGRAIADIAGSYAWRTRVSDLRHAPFFMQVENRQRRRGRFVVSEYRFAPRHEGTIEASG